MRRLSRPIRMRVSLIAAVLMSLSCSKKEPGPSTHDPFRAATTRPMGELLSLSLAVDWEPKVGQQVPWRIRIRNVSNGVVDVVPPLDGSDVGMRFPLYGVQLHGPDGRPVNWIRGGRCGNCNGIRRDEVIRLPPGEEMDMFLQAPLGHALSRWKPDREGKHRLTLTVDYSATDPAEWNGRLERVHADGAKVRALLAAVPRQRLVGTLEFDVVKF